jgi:hypothetical protein
MSLLCLLATLAMALLRTHASALWEGPPKPLAGLGSEDQYLSVDKLNLFHSWFEDAASSAFRADLATSRPTALSLSSTVLGNSSVFTALIQLLMFVLLCVSYFLPSMLSSDPCYLLYLTQLQVSTLSEFSVQRASQPLLPTTEVHDVSTQSSSCAR